MRNLIVLITALMLPMSALAHTGSHAGLGPVDGITHMIVEYFLPVVALNVASLLALRYRTRRADTKIPRSGNDQGEGRA